MSDSEKLEILKRLTDKVFEIRPVLGKTFDEYKDLSLLDFTTKQWEMNSSIVSDFRRDQVVGVISKYAGEILGSEIENSVRKQLDLNYSVITADHHGPITHPDFVNSNLLNSFAVQKSASKGVSNLIVLSFSNVSLNNFSFPRGHLLHVIKDGEVSLNQLPFSPSKDRQCPVFRYPPFTKDSLVKAMSRLKTWKEDEIIVESNVQKINEIIEEIYVKQAVLSLKSYSEQVTMSNYYLWNKLICNLKVKPNLLYFEIESIVGELLNKFHVNEDTIISKLLFDDRYHENLLKYFDGIIAAFTQSDYSGTFLFWAMPKDQKYRLSLWKNGNRLESLDGSYSIELNPEAIGSAIRAKELIPSTLLSFILLSFYYGLVLMGGGGQTTYLTKMKDAYLKLLRDVDNQAEVKFVKNIPTDRLSFPYPSIAFIGTGKGEILPATMLDLFLYGQNDGMETILNNASNITLGQGLLREMPGLYRMLIPELEQESELLSLSTSDVDKLTGFSSEIRMVGNIV